MKCSEVEEKLEFYVNNRINVEDMDEDIKKHLETCNNCTNYSKIIHETKEILKCTKEAELYQYENIRKNDRDFKNEIWAKISLEEENAKVFPFVWIEVSVIIILIIISLYNTPIFSKETLKGFAILLILLGMIYTNYKEVEVDE